MYIGSLDILENSLQIGDQILPTTNPIQIKRKSTVPTTEPSSVFRANYNEDLDIIKLHKHIRDIFAYERKVKLPLLIKQLEYEKEQVGSPQSVTKRKDSKIYIECLEKEIIRIKQQAEYKSYLSNCKPLLTSFVSIGVKQNIVTFDGNGCSTKKVYNKDSDGDDTTSQRMKIIDRYLELVTQIAGSYITLELEKPIVNISLCPECNTQIGDIESGHCPSCGMERDFMVESMPEEDSSSVRQLDQFTMNYQHRDEVSDAKENFETELAKYQGKKVGPAIKEKLFDKLKAYFSQIGFTSAAEIRMMPLNSDGRTRGPSNKDLMIGALISIGEKEAIEDINHICACMWGWKLPDVTHLESLVKNDHDKTQYIQKAFPDHRISSLNVRFLLKMLLQRWGHKCLGDDFKDIQTSKIKLYHRDRYEFVCSKLGWETPTED